MGEVENIYLNELPQKTLTYYAGKAWNTDAIPTQ